MSKMIQSRTILVFVLVGIFLLGGSYVAQSAWEAVTVIFDNTPPEIKEDTTTSGDVSYGNGKLSVVTHIYEAGDMEKVTCELFSGLPPTGTKLETLTLTLDQKLTSTLYRYTGTFAKTLVKESTYRLKYWATDKSGLKDNYATSIRLLNLDGYVTVNGKKIDSPDDTIFVRSSDLNINVYITAGADTVQNIQCQVNGVNVVSFTKKGNIVSGFYWHATYQLPKEGAYSFLVVVLDTAGNDAQLASFGIILGTQYKNWMIWGAIVILGIIGISAYMQRDTKPKAKKTKKKKTKTKKKARRKK